MVLSSKGFLTLARVSCVLRPGGVFGSVSRDWTHPAHLDIIWAWGGCLSFPSEVQNPKREKKVFFTFSYFLGGVHFLYFRVEYVIFLIAF